MKYNLLLAGVILSTLPILGAAAHAALVTFDDATQLNQFVLNGDANTTLAVSSTAGIGGGGGLTSTSNDYNNSSAIFSTGLDNSIGSSVFVQIDYRMQLQTTGPDLRLGFAAGVNSSFEGGNLWVETSGGNNLKFFGFDVQSSYTAFPSVSMIQGDWFRLRLAIVKQTATDYDATATLYDLGASGLSSAVVLSSDNFSFSSSYLGSASQLYSGFFLFQQTTAADNFVNSAPEAPLPATALSGFSMLAGMGGHLRPAQMSHRPHQDCLSRHLGS